MFEELLNLDKTTEETHIAGVMEKEDIKFNVFKEAAKPGMFHLHKFGKIHLKG